MTTLSKLSATIAELKAIAPQPHWSGAVRQVDWLLPYESVDPDTGERMTVHAVNVGGALFVSAHAWNALKEATVRG